MLIIGYMLLSITKPQNLKAIHNSHQRTMSARLVVINHKITKFESNSQLALCSYAQRIVVINHKITKFESNSQLRSRALVYPVSCYQSQNYKIRKQFTTNPTFNLSCYELLSITKLQNQKAIHNTKYPPQCRSYDVINHKTTKFESNSQLFLHKKVLICFII